MQIMTEKQQDLVQLEQIVEQRLDKRLAEFRVAAQSQAQGTGTLELELKHQRELMQQGFEHMNKRFEELRSDMNQRFEMLISSMDKRFETVDKRFAFMQWMMAAGFGLMGLMMSLYKFFP